MAFRARMRVKNPAGEDKVLIELQRRGLIEKMNQRGTIILFYDATPEKARIVQKEKFTREMAAECDALTIPDFPFLHYGFAGYLDGPPHKRRGVKNRDDEINRRLDAAGIKPLRFPYKPPLSDKLCREIVDEMENEMNGYIRTFRV